MTAIATATVQEDNNQKNVVLPAMPFLSFTPLVERDPKSKVEVHVHAKSLPGFSMYLISHVIE